MRAFVFWISRRSADSDGNGTIRPSHGGAPQCRAPTSNSSAGVRQFMGRPWLDPVPLLNGKVPE